MLENESNIVSEIASIFFERLTEIDPKWNKGFFRFFYDKGSSDATSSYIRTDKKIFLVGAFDNSDCEDLICELFEKLFTCLSKDKGVALLYVNRNEEFEMFFEFKDFNRWKITKLKGQSGLPKGFSID